MASSLVSVIIPVYNGSNYLAEAIDSVLAQTYANIEIIVVNDGSKDEGETDRIARSYGEKIRYFHKPNGGVATALNLAIREMKGEYFSWLSHDDMYYPNKIERQIAAVMNHSNRRTIVHSDYDLLNMRTDEIIHVKNTTEYTREELENSVFPVLHGLIHGCTLLIHRSYFQQSGVFDESLLTTQDYDLWFRFFRNERTLYINEPLVIARVHESQGSRTIHIHEKERNELHIKMMKSMTVEEMCEMYGSPYHFYYRLQLFCKRWNMAEAYEYANAKFKMTDAPPDLIFQLQALRGYIHGLSDGGANQVCIFGAGDYGTRLYEELSNRLVHVDYFSDNNQVKWGNRYGDVVCLSPIALQEYKERTLVIVAMQTPDAVVNQLKSQGFPYITTKQEIDSMLSSTLPARKTQ